MRYCNKTIAIITSSYLSATVEEIQDLLVNKGLTPRSKESIIKYVAKLNGADDCDLRKIESTLNPIKYRARSLYYGAKQRAKVKSIPFDLTIDWVEERLRKGVCEMSGIKFNIKVYDNTVFHVDPYAPSIDQILPSKGYTKSNSRVVVDFYNKMKNDRTDIETMAFCKEILTNYINKSISIN